jgi:putative endonuclease
MIRAFSTAASAIHNSRVGDGGPGQGAATVRRMTKVRQAVGAYGERLAVQHLVDAGLVVLDRNWRSGTGEIDIVARDGEALVLCEVKTRRGVGFGTPAEAVSRRKAVRLRRLAAEWLAHSGVRPSEVRFDVVEIFSPPQGAPRVRHIRAAF